MPIRACRLIRKMRGGAQAHLMEGEDGNFYVVKFTNNPQHRRILINEWLAGAFLRYLQIHVPDTAIIELTEDFVASNPDLYLSLGSKREPVPAGFHFGSRLAVHPDRVAIYDFLPDKLLGKVENRLDFLGILVFDKWVGNADSRQAVFFRARAKTWTPLKGESPARVGFFAHMIDHGFAFNGASWEFQDSPIQGLYFRTSVYDEVLSLDSFQPWLSMIENFPVEVIDTAWKQIPSVWVQEDGDQLERLLENLLKRRTRVGSLLSEARQKRTTAFVNWR
ncbi:MAG: phosphatidylinositol kinase [Acidobacteriaceae bacterium]|nr:phosphatidylinositol kinase [Acidobacteriaceae bacterium]MBV9676311.1 phosphatidylinositol kinase [Acidobacteriaceae bacterium]